METNKVRTYDDILDVIFEGRNKQYGAYFLRKLYPTNIKKALLYGVLIFAFLVTIPLWAKFINFGAKDQEELSNVKVELKDVVEKKKEDKPLPPPPPKKVEPPKPPSVKFTPPIIKKDTEVKEKEPPKVDDITVNTGTETVKSTETKYIPQVEEVAAPVEDPDEGKVFTFVEQQPSFPGGNDALLEYLGKNIKYPAIAKENGIEGRVVLTFVVDKSGNVTNIQTKKGIGGGCDEEAMRVVKSMPKWKPGKQNGKEVKVQFTLPVSFKLQ